MLRRLVTRIYFSDEPANAGDFVLNLVEPERRATLIARKNANHLGTLEWNVILQDLDETVFFLIAEKRLGGCETDTPHRPLRVLLPPSL